MCSRRASAGPRSTATPRGWTCCAPPAPARPRVRAGHRRRGAEREMRDLVRQHFAADRGRGRATCSTSTSCNEAGITMISGTLFDSAGLVGPACWNCSGCTRWTRRLRPNVSAAQPGVELMVRMAPHFDAPSSSRWSSRARAVRRPCGRRNVTSASAAGMRDVGWGRVAVVAAVDQGAALQRFRWCPSHSSLTPVSASPA